MLNIPDLLPFATAGAPFKTLFMEKKNSFNKGMIINIVLFIGLIALYSIHFLGPDPEQGVSDSGQHMLGVERKIDEAFQSIAIVDNEVLLEEYLLAVKMRADYEAEKLRLENDLERRQRNFQTEVERFQRDIERGHVSMAKAQILEQELMLQQQDIFQLGDTYRERLIRKEMEMNSALLDKIEDFLERYNRDKGYDFILGYARGGGILHANKAHDITAEVLEQLNLEYEAMH